ncbi:hypothetical protein VNI00_006749 [Paramarasmius palmivorus]|uniref:Large catalase C-terminal domain-containing protein n=1 Tax=Paramarasmius palmivorus TaxID=297713 RepID=A0AAW0D827_9AGAR
MLKTSAGLRVSILATTVNNSTASVQRAVSIAQVLNAKGVFGAVIAETLTDGVDATYIASDATGVFVCDHTDKLYDAAQTSFTSLYLSQRLMTIVRVRYTCGKPIGAVGWGRQVLDQAFSGGCGVGKRGVYIAEDVRNLVDVFEESQRLD